MPGIPVVWRLNGKRRGYTIDGGIHFYMGYRPGRPDHDIYRELGIYQEDQYLEMTKYGRFLDPSPWTFSGYHSGPGSTRRNHEGYLP